MWRNCDYLESRTRDAKASSEKEIWEGDRGAEYGEVDV
jgi:hypothetical protein